MRLVLHELRAQQLLFWRNREAAFFSFLFPILLLVLIGSVYGDEDDRGRERTDLPSHRADRLRRRGQRLRRARDHARRPARGRACSSACAARRSAGHLSPRRDRLDGRRDRAPGSRPAPPRRLRPRRRLARRPARLRLRHPARRGRLRRARARGHDRRPNRRGLIRRRQRHLPADGFISGVFFSTEEMPAFLEAISEVLPLTYFLDLIRACFVEARASRRRQSPSSRSGASSASSSRCAVPLGAARGNRGVLSSRLRRCYRDRRAPVAQWIEQRFPKPRAHVRSCRGQSRGRPRPAR